MTANISIDPGASGGIAWKFLGRVDATPMPATWADAVDYIRDIACRMELEGYTPVVYMEKVSGFIGENQPGSRMFNFGEGYGYIQGALCALNVKCVLIAPQTWQKHYNFGAKKKRVTKNGKTVTDKTEWKNRLKSEAQRRFPELNVTLETSDALLILDYAEGLK